MEDKKYIISEFYTLQADKKMILEAEKSEFGIIALVGILQKADTINRNGRIYPFEILSREAKKYMELVDQRTAYGELDHPESQIISLSNTSHMVVDMWWEGKTLYGKIVLFDQTNAGGILKDILKKGGVLGISSRGVGSVKNINGKDIVQEDFELIGFDIVSSPSTPGAYMFKEGEENLKPGMFEITDKKQLERLKKPKNEDISSKTERYKEFLKSIGDDFWKKL